VISEAIIQQVREANDIADLISGYMRLKRRGQNYLGLCPFHDEKTPSFNVNPARQIYHCFGCGKGGDAIGFLMEHERMGFVEALELLATRAHIELPKEHRQNEEALDVVYRAQAVAAEYFSRALGHDEMGKTTRTYLASRGVKESSISEFQVGFAPKLARGLVKYAARHGLEAHDLERAGLTYKSSEGARNRFVERLMFPIRNLSGKTIAFGGRDLSGHARAKYLNSPETPIYQKSRVLYGLYEGRSALQSANEVLICEGYFDVLRLHEYGFKNTVAVSGTALSADQARLLARYVDSARIIFDADGAGQKAALRSVPVLFDAGIDVLLVDLGKGDDPDSFLQAHGGDALKGQLDRAVNYVEYMEIQAGGSFDQLTPTARDKVLADIKDTIGRVTDPVRKELLSQAVWSRFGISEQVFRARMAAPGRRDQKERSSPNSSIGTVPDWKAEFLQLLVLEPQIRARAMTDISPADFDDPLQESLLTYLLDPRYIAQDVATLIGGTESPEISQLIGKLASFERPTSEVSLEDYLTKFRLIRLGERSRSLVSRIRQAEKDGHQESADKLSLEHQEVRAEWIALTKSRRRS
jgi:DNA primase